VIKKKDISVITLEVDYIIPNSKIGILRLKADVWPNGGGEFPAFSMGFPDISPEQAKGGAFVEFSKTTDLTKYVEDFKAKIKLLTNKTI
jgi:hypothetical protein